MLTWRSGLWSFFLLLATYDGVFAQDCAPNGLCTGRDLVAALLNETVATAHLWENIRLASDDWPETGIVLRRNLTLKGPGASNVLIDFAGLSSKITLAPGVVLTLQDLECRNSGSGVLFGFDLLTRSPGARVELRRVAVFAYVCLPFEFLVPVIRGYRPTMPTVSMLDAQQRIVAGGAWCRTTPGAARCYNSTVSLVRAVLPLDPSSGSEATATGAVGKDDLHDSYVLVAYNSTLVCQELTTPSCGVKEGYRSCLATRREQLGAADNTWSLLAEAEAQEWLDSDGDGDGDDGDAAAVGSTVGAGGARLSTGQLAGIIIGSVLGGLVFLLLGFGLGRTLWRHLGVITGTHQKQVQGSQRQQPRIEKDREIPPALQLRQLQPVEPRQQQCSPQEQQQQLWQSQCHPCTGSQMAQPCGEFDPQHQQQPQQPQQPQQQLQIEAPGAGQLSPQLTDYPTDSAWAKQVWRRWLGGNKEGATAEEEDPSDPRVAELDVSDAGGVGAGGAGGGDGRQGTCERVGGGGGGCHSGSPAAVAPGSTNEPAVFLGSPGPRSVPTAAAEIGADEVAAPDAARNEARVRVVSMSEAAGHLRQQQQQQQLLEQARRHRGQRPLVQRQQQEQQPLSYDTVTMTTASGAQQDLYNNK